MGPGLKGIMTEQESSLSLTPRDRPFWDSHSLEVLKEDQVVRRMYEFYKMLPFTLTKQTVKILKWPGAVGLACNLAFGKLSQEDKGQPV